MPNLNRKGATKQLQFIRAFLGYFEKKGGMIYKDEYERVMGASTFKCISIWNASNHRPSKHPQGIPKWVLYTNQDYLGHWDVGFLYNYYWLGEHVSQKEIRIQIKSEFSLKLYKELQHIYMGTQIVQYLAVYGHPPSPNVDRKAITEIDGFVLYRVS